VSGRKSWDVRQKKYEQWVKSSIPHGEWTIIRQALQRGQLTGSIKFVDEIVQKLNLRVEFRGQGRPCKKKGMGKTSI
jgi:putative transposase